MCGIIGIIQRDQPLDPFLLERATRALSHRGPDGQGTWISPRGRAGLGHRRLAVMAPANGTQPLSCEGGRFHLVVSGEFYGFEEIRRDLEERGHRFRSGSDSEIAIHLHEEKGMDALAELEGEFAFLLWDEDRGELLAVRDRFGIRPLCYAVTGAGVFIASEAKALFAAGVPAAWDEESFFHAASMQYVLPDRTLFRGVRQVPPGHYLRVRGGQVQLRRYWDLDLPCDGAVPP